MHPHRLYCRHLGRPRVHGLLDTESLYQASATPERDVDSYVTVTDTMFHSRRQVGRCARKPSQCRLTDSG
ncbi:hypothetical protein IG631_13773 [Alternaria alternata]|nr:hypothetical protein IG631_13773 [Alternaria alternata]